MKRPKFFSAIPILTALTLAVFFSACSAIKRGKVVNKGVNQTGTKLHPGPIHWVDVRGENTKGKVVTARIEFFAMDWKTIKKGQWIAPASYGFPRFLQRIHAYKEEQRQESGHFASSGTIAKSKGRTKTKRVARRTPATTPEPIEAVTSPPASHTPTPVAVEREERLRLVREKAIEDESVRAMKKNIHSARSDEEQARAWKEYRSALHEKMRTLDPTLSDLIDQQDAAPPGGSVPAPQAPR